MLVHSEVALTVVRSRVALVEGKDEVNLFSAMIDQWNIADLQVLPVGGKRGFKAGLEAVLANARTQHIQLSAIGVFRDADDDPRIAFESVSGTLHTIDLPVPPRSGQFAQGFPSVGVFILPDGQSPGAVEQLCWGSVNNTPAGQCATSYLECLQISGSLMSRNPAKTMVHAYLAAQEEPSTTVGVGAQKDYWPLHHTAFTEVRRFLERLASI